MPDAILSVDRLRVSFAAQGGSIEAVSDLGFEVRAGETLCIVGESGSGKSVSALSLMRLEGFKGGHLDAGRILFTRETGDQIALERAHRRELRQLRGDEIGMIFQEPMSALNPVLTIGRQITEGLRLHKALDRVAARARAIEVLGEVRMPDPGRCLAQYPHELSGGMRQRVMIAMALACGPRLLIADEPTTALDVTTQAEILSLIDLLRRKHNMAVIFITHDMGVVAQMADRVVVMQAGVKVEEGTVEQIFSAPVHPYTQALLAAVPRLGDMRGRSFPCTVTLPGSDTPVREVRGTDDVLLRVENLAVRYPLRTGLLRRQSAQVHAVEDVSFMLSRGRTLALVGESGCGKSSAARAFLRLIEPAAGRVVLNGCEITALAPAALRRMRSQMQMVFQDPFGSLNPVMRLGDQVSEPLRNFGTLSRGDLAARVSRLFDLVGLPQSYLNRYPHELSGGQRQRVAIARALAPEPALIVADEAVSALDVSVQARILNLMLELQAELSLSYIFISHDMAVVERMSHDVAVMYRGRIVECGPRASVLEHPQHPYTQKLLRAVPVADPRQRNRPRTISEDPLPVIKHPVGHAPLPSVYRCVGDRHVVLTTPGWC